MVKAVTVECLVDLRMSVAQYCVRTASNCQFGETNERVDSTLVFVLEPIRINTHKCCPLPVNAFSYVMSNCIFSNTIDCAWLRTRLVQVSHRLVVFSSCFRAVV